MPPQVVLELHPGNSTAHAQLMLTMPAIRQPLEAGHLLGQRAAKHLVKFLLDMEDPLQVLASTPSWLDLVRLLLAPSLVLALPLGVMVPVLVAKLLMLLRPVAITLLLRLLALVPHRLLARQLLRLADGTMLLRLPELPMHLRLVLQLITVPRLLQVGCLLHLVQWIMAGRDMKKGPPVRNSNHLVSPIYPLHFLLGL